MSRVLGVLVGGVIVGSFAIGSPLAMAAPGVWTPATTLAAAKQNGSSPKIAVAPNGAAVLTWGDYQTVMASTRPAGGTFGAPVAVSPPGEYAVSPSVAIAPDGAAVIQWRMSTPGGFGDVLKASSRPAGGAFAPPVTLSAPGIGFGANARVAVGANGAAIVTWSQSRDVLATYRPPGGTFGAPVTVVHDGYYSAINASAALAPDGTATVAWELSSSGGVQASTLPPSGAFSAPVTLDPKGFLPRIVVAADGGTTVLWENSTTSGRGVRTSVRPPGGAFASSPGTLISSPVGEEICYSQAVLAGAPNGRTIASWIDAARAVNASSTLPGGPFEAPGSVASAGSADQNCAGTVRDKVGAAIASDGSASVVWTGTAGILASARSGGGAFGAPVNVGSGTSDPVAVAGADDGVAFAAWQNSQGVQLATNSATPVIGAAPADAPAPTPATPAVPAKPTLRRATDTVVFSALKLRLSKSSATPKVVRVTISARGVKTKLVKTMKLTRVGSTYTLTGTIRLTKPLRNAKKLAITIRGKRVVTVQRTLTTP